MTRLNYRTRRQIARDGCTAQLPVTKYHEDLEMQYHDCQLSAEHYGVHLCWCGLAFNDVGERFTQRALWSDWALNSMHSSDPREVDTEQNN